MASLAFRQKENQIEETQKKKMEESYNERSRQRTKNVIEWLGTVDMIHEKVKIKNGKEKENEQELAPE